MHSVRNAASDEIPPPYRTPDKNQQRKQNGTRSAAASSSAGQADIGGSGRPGSGEGERRQEVGDLQ